MKIIAYDPEIPVEQKPEIYIRAISGPNGTNVVDIITCDINGVKFPQGNLVRFTSKGLYRYRGINKELGLPLNDNCQVETYY